MRARAGLTGNYEHDALSSGAVGEIDILDLLDYIRIVEVGGVTLGSEAETMRAYLREAMYGLHARDRFFRRPADIEFEDIEVSRARTRAWMAQDRD